MSAMKLEMQNRKQNMIRAAAVLILAAALFLAGCGAGRGGAYQSSAGRGGTGQENAAQSGADSPDHAGETSPGGLRKEEMGRICYYRYEKDEHFDADMEIVEGRINALTDGDYLKEETGLETSDGTLYAVNFYVPKEAYGENSLRDMSRILISRPMNFWLSNDTNDGPTNLFGERIAMPRDAIDSVEMLYGCPEHFNPPDYGIKQKEFNYLVITLTEEYSRENPQIWEWEQPYILQDIEGFSGYAHIALHPDAENRRMYIVEDEDRKGSCNSLYYSCTHEPLSDGFYLITCPVAEWESGEDIKGAGQIEPTEFKTATVVNEYAPEEEYVSDRNWEQTLQAIRERLDATGIPYALGHRPGADLSIVIRIEAGVFSFNFIDYVVQSTTVELSGCGESLNEDVSRVKVSPLALSGKKVLSLDLSALRKEALNKLSTICAKAGGGRIVLRVHGTAVAYGYCDEIINNGKFVMDCNALTAEEGFAGEMEWMPDFLEALIDGTQIPKDSYGIAGVTLQNTEQSYLTEEGQLYLPDFYEIPREKLYAAIRSGIGDMEYVQLGILTSGTPCLQFALPEGEKRNEQIAGIMSRVFKGLSDEIFTYWMRFDFLDGNGYPVMKIVTSKPDKGSKMKIGYTIFCESVFTEEDKAEIQRLLEENGAPATADL